ncbi:hypothetical protein ABE385_14595 [Bacillus velezensis]|uniref:hypothetical protein n=1 Tax=Bacillus velezensis TaxID=492670 RepID=UPI00100A922D|nr:hypothetical protein [Bacillus velezensis]MED1774995.1 hypothetical protein [Bacillus velezensis]RXK25496.1 hypothetical protein P42_19530 [Bacillus velezensis]
MDLDQALNELFKLLKIPVLACIFFILKNIKPVSFFSANVVEQRLFSKEQLFGFKVIKHILNTLFWMIVLYPATFYLRGIIPGPNDLFSYVIVIFGGIIWGVIVIINEGAFSKIKSSRLCKCIFVTVFMVCLILFYTQLYNFFIDSLLSEEFNLKILGISMLVLFLFTLPIPFILIPISKFIKWSNEQSVYIEDEKKQKWYILYSINKETVLLGNKNEQRLCSKTMIKRKEELYNTPIEMVKTDN